MESNKLILSYCHNFNKIVKAEFLEGDNISSYLVDIYKNYIFEVNINDLDELSEMQKLDEIMGKYVEDYKFREKMQKEIIGIRVKRNTSNILKTIVDAIIQIFKKIELESTRVIDISMWI